MKPDITFIHLAHLSAGERRALMQRAESDLAPHMKAIRPIIDAVRRKGDRALVRLACEFDGADIEPHEIAATDADFDRAFHTLDPEMIRVLEFCSDNVRRFHEAQMPDESWMKEMHPGVFAGEKIVPVESVACYVPRGKGAFPSVVMMTTIPAVVAGVPHPIILTPPGPDGSIDAATLVAAKLAGVTAIHKCGGAQAVAAAAFGTETVPRCHKIVGPGSPWVAAAKKLLADHLDTGIPAGPSEAIVLADGSANGKAAALDLLIESEHGADSSAWLITDSRAVAEQAMAAIPGYWTQMRPTRAGYSSAVLCGKAGGIILADNMDQAIDFVNDYAPEHLQVHSKNPHDYLPRLRNAGEILLGENTPICLGNFALGPNAVLPTNGAARTCSALGVHDFIKRISIGHATKAGYDLLAPMVNAFARYEGFDAHANAVSPLRQQALAQGNETAE